MTAAKQWRASERIGGRECIDFVNTVEWRGTPQPRDSLQSYEDLLEWSGAVGLLAAARAGRLARLARTAPGRAERVLERARELREALHAVFVSGAAGKRPRRHDVDTLNEVLDRAPARRHVRFTRGAYDWHGPDEESLQMVLWPIAWSAADLLTQGEPRRVRPCADERCGWLFYDTSRNRSRRWCSMRECGNRAKARRHYYRSKAAAAGGGQDG